MSEIVEYNPAFATPPAWLGYDKAEFVRGRLVINICGVCPGAHAAEIEAKRLRCETVRTLCAKHVAERIAGRLGETL